MERLIENQQLNVFPAGAGEAAQPETDIWRKSIAAQVFLNHYFGISYHIRQASDAYLLQHLPYFVNHKAASEAADTDLIKKYLFNCWNTEYALKNTAEINDEQYLRNALHWTFPQAYYSVYAGVQAFLATQGIRATNSEQVRREVGRLVVKGAYPNPVGFYAAGHFGDFRVFRLPFSKWKPGLELADKEPEAQAQIGQFLRTTRKLRAQNIRQRVQSDPSMAIRSLRTGEVLQKFNAAHWHQLTWRIGYTTYFDLLSRLQISGNHREIERFVESDIDFRLFHQSLLEIVSYLNFVHEAYVVKALGINTYKQLMEDLPGYLKNGFVEQRLKENIEPVLASLESDRHAEEAWNMSA
jgi:hypothetical protein